MRKIDTSGVPGYIKGFFMILAGIVFIVFPEQVSSVIGIIFAIILMVIGISGAVDYIISVKDFKEAGYGKAAGAEIVLVYSVIVMIIGFVFLLKPELVLQILALVVGLFFIIDGVVKIREATLVPRFKNIYWWILLILSRTVVVGLVGVAILILLVVASRSLVVVVPEEGVGDALGGIAASQFRILEVGQCNAVGIWCPDIALEGT